MLNSPYQSAMPKHSTKPIKHKGGANSNTENKVDEFLKKLTIEGNLIDKGQRFGFGSLGRAAYDEIKSKWAVLLRKILEEDEDLYKEITDYIAKTFRIEYLVGNSELSPD